MTARMITRTILLLGAATISFASASAAQAADAAARQYSIPAGDAGSAIQQLARDAGVQVMAPTADVRGVRTKPVRGTYTASEALALMLEGTGLEAVSSGGALIVRRAAATEPQADAQPSGQTETASDESIIVTGSRIERAGFDTLQSASVTDAEEIRRRSYTNILQALQDTPGFGPPGNSQLQASQGNFAIAQSFANLFNLGSQRTLTLVNGRRFVSSNTVSASGGGPQPGSQVDLNLIPVALVARTETIAIGGAPVYGSDAIAGTVNVILRNDFEGLDARAQAGITERGDAANQKVSVVVGKNFADGRGNIVLGAEYVRQEGMVYGERYNQFSLLSTGNTTPGDGIPQLAPVDRRLIVLTEGGLPFIGTAGPGAATYIRNPAGTGGPLQFGSDGSLVPFNLGETYVGGGTTYRRGGDGVDPADHSLLLSPNHRYLLNGMGHYDLTEGVTAFFEASYARTSGTKLSDLFQYSAPALGTAALTFRLDNPYLSQASRAILAANLPAGATTFNMARNLNDVADSRPAQTDLELYRVVAGLRGDFQLGGERWNWDVAYNYGRSRAESEFNQINPTRLANAIDAVGTPGNVTCRVGGACVPINLFGQGAFSQAAADYVIDKGLATSVNVLEEVVANIGGRLPFGISDPIAFNIGYTHRRESGSFEGNAILNGGLLLLGGALAYPDARERGFNTDEVYGEAILPLISDAMDLPVIRSAQAEGAIRYVDNSIAGGDITWSAGGRISPRLGAISEGLTLRGVYTRSIRAPSIVELFSNTTPLSAAGNDLCDPSRVNSGPNPTVRARNCAAALNAVGVTSGFAATTNGNSVFGTSGGNPNLNNEKANSWSVGVVYQPPVVPGLMLSVDYSRIKVLGAISTFTLGSAQAACYDSPNYPNEGGCSAFRRLTAAETTGYRVPRVAGDIADGFLNGFYNSAEINFAGWSLQAAYRMGMPNLAGGGDEGALRLKASAFHIERYTTQASGIAPVLNTQGTPGNPAWEVNGQIGYEFDPFDFDLQVLWTSATRLDPTLNSDITLVNRIAPYTLVNATLGFRVTDQFQLQFSVRNLLDKPLPYAALVNRNFNFDPLGRAYTASASIRF